MTIAKFQSEPAALSDKSNSIDVRNAVSDESLAAALQSIILTLCLKDELSAYDLALLNRLFENDRNLMIVKDRQCLFPLDFKQEDFSLCLVLQDGDLNVCDLHSRHPQVASQIENAWPSILAAANKIKELFAESDAAVLVNRSSGRILAVSGGFSAISGLTDEECTGQEYGELSRLYNSCFFGKKILLQNLNAKELYLSIVTISSPSHSFGSATLAKNSFQFSDSHPYRLLNESHAIGLYANRFNALLESSLKNTLYPETLVRLEQVISELTRYCRNNGRCLRTGMDSAGINACLRFLVQSNLMSHRNSAGESSDTEIKFDAGQNDEVLVTFITPANAIKKSIQAKDEWWELADNLAKRIGIQISELEIINQTITNRIQLTLNPTKRDYAK